MTSCKKAVFRLKHAANNNFMMYEKAVLKLLSNMISNTEFIFHFWSCSGYERSKWAMKNPSTIDAALEMTKQTQQVNSRGLILSFFTISHMGHCVVELHLHTVEIYEIGPYSDISQKF